MITIGGAWRSNVGASSSNKLLFIFSPTCHKRTQTTPALRQLRGDALLFLALWWGVLLYLGVTMVQGSEVTSQPTQPCVVIYHNYHLVFLVFFCYFTQVWTHFQLLDFILHSSTKQPQGDD